MHGLIEQMNRFIHTSSALIQSISYRIIEITDEELPLAPGPGSSYFYPVLGAMFALLLLLLLMGYGIMCYRYRKRILELDEDKAKASGWKLWELKEMIIELEEEKAEKAVKGIVY